MTGRITKTKMVFLYKKTPELDYIFNFLKEKINLRGNYDITYGKSRNTKSKIQIYQSDFWQNYKTKSSLPKNIKEFKYKNHNIVGLFHNNKELVEKRNNSIKINVDIIASIFFMLTRYEEYMQPELYDSTDRFPAKNSVAYKHNFLQRPVVDEYLHLLADCIEELTGEKPKIKDEFRVFTTHDVDRFLLGKNFLHRDIGADILVNKNFFLWPKRLANFLKSKFNYENDHLYQINNFFFENERQFNQIHYFLVEEGNYSIYDREVLEFIEKLKKNNVTVGLHGGSSSYQDNEQLAKEKKMFDKACAFNSEEVRQHLLKFKVPKTWQAQESAGLKYDSSCCFHDAEGFRCGTSREFKVFDLATDKVLNLVERPLVIMDATFKFYKKNLDNIFDVCKDYHKTCKKYNIPLTLLFHNRFFDYGSEDKLSEYKSLLESFSP